MQQVIAPELMLSISQMLVYGQLDSEILKLILLNNFF